MAELAERGRRGLHRRRPAGRARAGVMRQALQYQRLAGRVLALHEEDPTLSGAGVMHEGAVSALLGLAGIPSISESVEVARDCALAAYEDGRIHIQHVSAARVRGRDRARPRPRASGHRRGHAAPPDADRRRGPIGSTRASR